MNSQQASEQLSLFFSEADGQESETAMQHVPNDNDPYSIEPPVATIMAGDSLRHIPAELGDSSEPSQADHDYCEWSVFMREHGRVPLIEDVKKPWQYRGWLLYYRLLAEVHPAVGRRWDYWCRTTTTGKLLEEPIPQISFSAICDKQVMKDLDAWVHLVDRYSSGWAAVDKLLDWFLWGFGYSDKEPQLPHELNESLYRQVNLGPMLFHPHDYLGEWIMMQKGRWNPNAFYPTPHSIVEFMVKITMTEEKRDRRNQKVIDPAVGSGRMLMHASNYSLRLYGIDIDPTLVKVTLVNGALYVPWILRPFPESFFHEESSGVLDPSASECEATV
jgi:hypothetical protein